MFSPRSVYRPALFSTVSVAVLLAASVPLVVRAQDNAPAKEYDLKAEALLQKAADRLKNAKSFSGQVTNIMRIPATDKAPAREVRSARAFNLQKPNLIYQESGPLTKTASGAWNATFATPTAKYVSDGTKGVVFSLTQKNYRAAGVSSDDLSSFYALNFPEFFNPKMADAEQAREGKANGRLVSLKMAPDERFGGVPCSVVEEKTLLGKTEKGTSAYGTTKIYVGKKDGLIHGYHTETPDRSGDGSVEVSDDVLTNIALDRTIPASTFTLNLTGFKEFVAPKRPELLTAGTLAPDFTAYDKDGKAVKLSDFKGKVVVLDFWATWCGPCMASLPHTTEVAKKTADKGVVVLAVNVWDKKEEFDKWLPAHPEYGSLTFAIDTTPEQGQDVATKLYNVSGIPTQYVIDRSGKIVTSFVGFSGPTDALEKAIEKADTGSVAMAQK